MRPLSISVIFSMVFALSGCVTWPAGGHGGMAEHYQDTLIPVIPDQPLGPEHGLRFDLDLARQHLDILILEGAELCFPATVIQARQRQNDITRELYGNLDFDAANNLIVQRKLLARLERQLDYVKQQNVCMLPVTEGQEKPGDIGKRIHDLLNGDNQFSSHSPELNPKYVGQLAEAAQLLRNQPGYYLRITGYPDTLEKSTYNRKLSLQRAKKVRRYLQVMGLPAERIQVDAVDSDHPLSVNNDDDNDKQAYTKRATRHVSIELIEAPALIQTTRK